MLKESSLVKSFDILDFKQGADFYYLKMNAYLIDSSLLSIRLFISSDNYNYSFHWQDSLGKLIVRWDNSPHHHDLDTYPHHKHLENMVEASSELSLEDVLSYIKTFLTEKNG